MSEQLMQQLEETEDESAASYVRVDKLLYPCNPWTNVKEGGFYQLGRERDAYGNYESYLINEEDRHIFSWGSLMTGTFFKNK